MVLGASDHQVLVVSRLIHSQTHYWTLVTRELPSRDKSDNKKKNQVFTFELLNYHLYQYKDENDTNTTGYFQGFKCFLKNAFKRFLEKKTVLFTFMFLKGILI